MARIIYTGIDPGVIELSVDEVDEQRSLRSRVDDVRS